MITRELANSRPFDRCAAMTAATMVANEGD